MKNEDKQLFAFVIMPFKQELDDLYKIGIKTVTKSLEVRAERLDDQIFSEGMLQRIYKQIEKADFIIAVLSERNVNVFYELGYAHAKNKTCILLTDDSENIPFDLKHHSHIIYDSLSDLNIKLTKTINWAKNEVLLKYKSNIDVEVKASGDIDLDEYKSNVNVTFSIDLHNKTDEVSAEISAIYLYSSGLWIVSQDGKKAPSTISDLDEFKLRYFIKTPVNKIGKKGFTNLTILATKQLSNYQTHNELIDKYHIDSVGMLRLETSVGNYDHPFPIKLKIEHIPF